MRDRDAAILGSASAERPGATILTMSDTKLRELERRWKETGSLDDEAAYLRERVRAGGLSSECLELAAFCGHGAACRALSSAVPDVSGDLVEWAGGLQRWGQVAATVAALSAAKQVLPGIRKRDERRRANVALVRVAAWLRCPCDTHRERAAESASHLCWPGLAKGTRAAQMAAETACSGTEWTSGRTDAERAQIAIGSAQRAGPVEARDVLDDVARWALDGAVPGI